MGTTPVNRALGELHGKIDDYVFRNVEGETIVARRPRKLKIPPTDNQVAVRERFLFAAQYAKSVFADPVRKQPYLDFADATGVSRRRLFGIVLRDYLSPPVIKDISTTFYHRRVGDELRILALDDVKVTGVSVKISRQSDGSLLEAGVATYVGPHWSYVATVAAPAAPEPLVIEVTAADVAQNHGVETMGLRT